VVPTSAITGDGLPDLLGLLVQLPQTRMAEKLQYVKDLQATMLEVRTLKTETPGP